MTTFTKHDHDKPRLDLVPPGPLLDVAAVYTYGAKKYSADNWQHAGDDGARRFFSAAMRHLLAWQAGEELDPESQLPHLAHAAANLFIIMALASRKP